MLCLLARKDTSNHFNFRVRDTAMQSGRDCEKTKCHNALLT